MDVEDYSDNEYYKDNVYEKNKENSNNLNKMVKKAYEEDNCNKKPSGLTVKDNWNKADEILDEEQLKEKYDSGYDEKRLSNDIHCKKCPLNCGVDVSPSLFQHFSEKHCKKLNKIISGDYKVCKYNACHLVKTKYIEKHYEHCQFNYDNLSDDALEEKDDLFYVFLKNYLKEIVKSGKKKKDEEVLEFGENEKNPLNGFDNLELNQEEVEYTRRRENKVNLLYESKDNYEFIKDTELYNKMLFGENFVIHDMN